MAAMGDLITFDYSLGQVVHDKNPKVLVLHPNWQGQMHGLNFNYLTEQEINYIKAVLSPTFESQIVQTDRRIAIQMTRVRAIIDTLNITSPMDFYARFVRGFIQPRGWDPYRRYTTSKQRSMRTITPSAIMTGDQPEQGIFHKAMNKLKNWTGGNPGLSRLSNLASPGVLPTVGGPTPGPMPASPNRGGLGGQGGKLPGKGPLGGGNQP